MKTLTAEEAAQVLGVTTSRVRQMIRGGQLPASRFGKSHVIFEKDLALVRERPVGRPPKPKAETTGTGSATKKPRARKAR